MGRLLWRAAVGKCSWPLCWAASAAAGLAPARTQDLLGASCPVQGAAPAMHCTPPPRHRLTADSLQTDRLESKHRGPHMHSKCPGRHKTAAAAETCRCQADLGRHGSSEACHHVGNGPSREAWEAPRGPAVGLGWGSEPLRGSHCLGVASCAQGVTLLGHAGSDHGLGLRLRQPPNRGPCSWWWPSRPTCHASRLWHTCASATPHAGQAARMHAARWA